MSKIKLRYLIVFVFTILVIAFTLLCINVFFSKYSLSIKIEKYINSNSDKNNDYKFYMSEITDFKWDKMLIYQVGSSNKEISDLLGVPFNDSLDLASGIIFVYKNKIIYKEQQYYNPDKPYKLLFYIGEMYGQPKYGIYTPNDALFEGNRREIDGKIYYKIVPISKIIN